MWPCDWHLRKYQKWHTYRGNVTYILFHIQLAVFRKRGSQDCSARCVLLEGIICAHTPLLVAGVASDLAGKVRCQSSVASTSPMRLQVNTVMLYSVPVQFASLSASVSLLLGWIGTHSETTSRNWSAALFLERCDLGFEEGDIAAGLGARACVRWNERCMASCGATAGIILLLQSGYALFERYGRLRWIRPSEKLVRYGKVGREKACAVK